MYPKTENNEVSSTFLWQIGLLTFLVLVIITYSTRYLESERINAGPDTQTLSFPWLVAGRHTIENALGAFSGKSPKDVKINEVARGLAALLFSGVICPTVFLLEWRRRKLSHTPGEDHKPLSVSIVFYGLCAAMTLYFAVAMLPMTYSGEMVRTSVRAAQAVHFNRDDIINEINDLAANAYQYYLLPKELGGGGRSYEQFVPPQEMLKSESARYVVTPAGREMKMRASSVPFVDCTIEVKLDSTGRLSEWNYAGRFR